MIFVKNDKAARIITDFSVGMAMELVPKPKRFRVSKTLHLKPEIWEMLDDIVKTKGIGICEGIEQMISDYWIWQSSKLKVSKEGTLEIFSQENLK